MADAAAVSANLVRCFDASKFSAEPFRHWLLSDILPVRVCDGIDALPVRPPKIEDTEGKRETHNSSRLFFGSDNRRRHPVCEALAAGFQSAATVERIERLCGVELRGEAEQVEAGIVGDQLDPVGVGRIEIGGLGRELHFETRIGRLLTR